MQPEREFRIVIDTPESGRLTESERAYDQLHGRPPAQRRAAGEQLRHRGQGTATEDQPGPGVLLGIPERAERLLEVGRSAGVAETR